MTKDEQFSDDGELLVTSMTRPSMIGGLTMSSIVLSLYLPGVIAMITNTLWAGLLVPVLFLICYLVCLKDVYLFEVLKATAHLKACVNQRHWGCRRYAPR